MSIVQISRITHRKGLKSELPQLAGAELGWVIDERKLFIGNGTIAEGAPAIGNTEILTEYSDLLSTVSGYTYKGEAGGYIAQTGGTTSSPVLRSLQSKLDDFASIKDFGAVGDGVADDTEAINRAFGQLSYKGRSVYFPAGVYKITDSLLIPPYTKMYGDGAGSTIICLDTGNKSTNAYVARTCDSLRQIDANIGSNSAIVPKNIEISDLTFQAANIGSVFLVQLAEQVYFDGVNFVGSLTQADLSNLSENVAGVHFDSSAAIVTNQIIFDKCKFSGLTYGIQTNEKIQGITVSNSKFETLYNGILMGDNSGPSGVRILHNLFDNIAFEGIKFGNISLNISAYNIFLNVATNFRGGNYYPVASVIRFNGANNVSVGDMFERDEANNILVPRVSFSDNGGFALENAQRYKFGSYNRNRGYQTTLSMQSSPANIFKISTTETVAFKVEYQFKVNNKNSYRSGVLNVVITDTGGSTSSLSYTDDYVENAATGLVLLVTQTGTDVNINYTFSSNSLLDTGTFFYSVTNFN